MWNQGLGWQKNHKTASNLVYPNTTFFSKVSRKFGIEIRGWFGKFVENIALFLGINNFYF